MEGIRTEDRLGIESFDRDTNGFVKDMSGTYILPGRSYSTYTRRYQISKRCSDHLMIQGLRRGRHTHPLMPKSPKGSAVKNRHTRKTDRSTDHRIPGRQNNRVTRLVDLDQFLWRQRFGNNDLVYESTQNPSVRLSVGKNRQKRTR